VSFLPLDLMYMDVSRLGVGERWSARSAASSNLLLCRRYTSSIRSVISFAISESQKYPCSPVGATQTAFVAETLLPTRNGKYRLRGYRHTVRDQPQTVLWNADRARIKLMKHVFSHCFVFIVWFDCKSFRSNAWMTSSFSHSRWTDGARAPSPLQ
jgi:hypothetical protein